MLNPEEKKDPKEPKLPILSTREFAPEHWIATNEVPGRIVSQLHPWERVIYIDKPSVTRPQHAPSSLKQIMRLTGADKLTQVGDFGPSIASLSTTANEGIKAMTRYQTAHGRDALRVALDLHKEYPDLLSTTITALAMTQGVVDEDFHPGTPYRQEEKGKIMLLNRPPGDTFRERLTKEKNWGWPFFGSVDATPSYIIAIAEFVKIHGDSYLKEKGYDFLSSNYRGLDGKVHSIGQSFFSALDWLLNKLADNREGLLEFKNNDASGGSAGMPNQAWKDNDSAYVHANGEWANHKSGIASVEVQARAYDALLYAAELIIEKYNDPTLAEALVKQAENLKSTILDRLWTTENGGYFVLGTDRDDKGNLRQLKVRTSNMGHLLNSRLLDGNAPDIIQKREATVRALFSNALMSPFGVRTLANNELSFRKEGYHTGSVWLWDNAYIARGLERHGYFGLSWHIRNCLYNTVMETKSFPEFVPGDNSPHVHLNESDVYVYDQKHDSVYLYEQVPQEIQAWTVSAILSMKYDANMPRSAQNTVLQKQEETIMAGLPPR